MKAKTNRTKYIEEAANNLADLNVLYGVIALLEGGTIIRSSRAADRIIKICKDEGQRRLRDYDKYCRLAVRGAP